MASEKAWGAIFFVFSLLVLLYISVLGTIVLYQATVEGKINEAITQGTTLLGMIPYPPLIWLIWIIVALSVLVIALIFMWVGISLMRTPSLEDINVEELEKEVEKELAQQKEQEKEGE